MTIYIIALLVSFLILGTMFYLLRKRVTGLKRVQLNFIIIGLATTIVAALVTNLVLPFFNFYQLNKIGPIFTLFLSVSIIYASTKHHLLETKVIVSEVWSAILVFVMLSWFLMNMNLGSFAIFAMVVTANILFIRSVLSESSKNEQIHRQYIQLENANLKLENDKKDLQELDRMKDEFLQMATHELNTPITVIQGRLDMAIKENLCKLDEKQKEFLTPVLNDTERLASLSRDILDTARIDQHRLTINADETDLDTLITQIVSDFEIKAKEKENSIAYIRLSKSLPMLKIDKSKIGEVITNLINNANKFTEKGKIAVTSKLTENGIVVSVADTGVGIDKEAQRHLFEKFYQAGRFDPNNPQEQQGSGLGLYISNNIIKLHGGKMWLESEKGKGSAFYFSLPLVYNEIKEQPEKDPNIKESSVQTAFNN